MAARHCRACRFALSVGADGCSYRSQRVMPKTISPALDAHRALGSTHLAWFVKATRVQADNAVYAFTTYPYPLTIDGVVYEPGFNRTSIVTAGDLAVDNLEIMGAMVSDA